MLSPWTTHLSIRSTLLHLLDVKAPVQKRTCLCEQSSNSTLIPMAVSTQHALSAKHRLLRRQHRNTQSYNSPLQLTSQRLLQQQGAKPHSPPLAKHQQPRRHLRLGRATRHQHPLHKTPPVELLPKHQQVEVPDRLEVAVRRPPLRAARLTTAELQHSLTPKTQGSKRGTLQAWPTQIQASPQPGHKRTLSVSYKTVVCTIVVAGKWTTSAAMSTISSVAERASVVKI